MDGKRRIAFGGAALAVLLALSLVVGMQTSGDRGEGAMDSVAGLAGHEEDGLTRAAPPAAEGTGSAGASGDTLRSGAVGSGAGTSAPAPAVVRTASVDVRVQRDGFTRAWAAANAVATRFGGFVANSQANTAHGDEERLARGTLTLRIPAEHLDAALAELAGLGTLVAQSSSANDVSGQLFDFDARIRTLETQELQTLEILKQARTVTEILEVRSRLDSVRAEIEQLKGRRQFLQQQVDLSTVTATIFEPGAAPAPTTAPGRIAEAWARALDVAMTIAAGSIIVMGAIVPLALLAALVWAAMRLARRRPPAAAGGSASS